MGLQAEAPRAIVNSWTVNFKGSIKGWFGYSGLTWVQEQQFCEYSSCYFKIRRSLKKCSSHIDPLHSSPHTFVRRTVVDYQLFQSTNLFFGGSTVWALRPIPPLGVRSDTWCPAQNEVCLRSGLTLDHNVSPGPTGKHVTRQAVTLPRVIFFGAWHNSGQWTSFFPTNAPIIITDALL